MLVVLCFQPFLHHVAQCIIPAPCNAPETVNALSLYLPELQPAMPVQAAVLPGLKALRNAIHIFLS